jgi:3-methyl-2-oxobutanoate hydroxymethyltransferase
MKEAGAEAVKLEGGAELEPTVRLLRRAGVAVMGHLGLTPQSVHAMGGYKIQGREPKAAAKLLADAKALQAAGAFSLVLEGVPAALARKVSRALAIPTIGIGAGPDCDGQILVFHDMMNLTFAPAAKFVRRYADASALFRAAIEHYREDVEHRAFPSDEESYHLSEAVRKEVSTAHEAPISIQALHKA